MFPFKRKLVLPGETEIKAGDIIGFSGRSWISAGINIATYGIPLWGISHVGIMANAPGRQPADLREHVAGGDLPCEITGEASSAARKPTCSTTSSGTTRQGVALSALPAAVPE